MKKELLSKRLKKVASFVTDGAVVADIGSDHAQLPVYLVQEGIIHEAIAGDVNIGPLQAAKNQIEKYNLQNKIKAKLGNGLEVIEGEAVDTIVIAGMGGPLIAQILEDGKERLKSVSRLILQPNIAAEHIRKWLINEDWELKDEVILEEGGHIYEILVAEKGNPLAPYREELHKEIWLGPFLLQKKCAIFKKKWSSELQQLEKINDQLSAIKASSNETNERKSEIEEKINWLREELN